MKKILPWLCLLLSVYYAIIAIASIGTDPEIASSYGISAVVILIVFFILRKKNMKRSHEAAPTKTAEPGETPSPVKVAAHTMPRGYISGLPELPGYTVKYTYDEVKIALADKFFPIVDLQFDDLLTLKQEPENPYDSKAVAIYRGEDQLGYLYRGRLQDMANDWLDRGDPVYGLYEASTDIETFTIYFFS